MFTDAFMDALPDDHMKQQELFATGSMNTTRIWEKGIIVRKSTSRLLRLMQFSKRW